MERKNILVLTGSPRRNGNSDRLAEAFMKGALSKGHEVHRFDAARQKISGCIACKACWRKDSPCSFQDGFNELAPMLEVADVIVFATPIYWFNFPAQIKAVIDKMNAYLADDCKRPLKIKESLLLVCGGDEGEDIFEGINVTYRQISEYMGWKDRGILMVPGVSGKGDIEKTDAIVKAENYGRSI